MNASLAHSLAWSEPTREQKPLLVALAIALSLHLILLSIHFATPERTPSKPSLPIVQIDLQSMPPSPPSCTSAPVGRAALASSAWFHAAA